MGKRQHQKDKICITYTEWTTLYGGKKTGSDVANFRRLPFDHCCLSLQPFENPYCDPDGNIFDLKFIIPYIAKFNSNPVTGEALDSNSLIKLNFQKNSEGDYHCPVLFKTFNRQSHIVAIRKTGNVFSYEAVEQLNVKAKFWKDLLTDEPFVKGDLITLQDPVNVDKCNISSFYHIRHNIRVETEGRRETSAALKTVSAETRDILQELNRDYKPCKAKAEEERKIADKFNAAHYSTGAVAAGFTSTSCVPLTEHEAGIIDEDLVRYERVKKKGYIRLVTNRGFLNLELHCDMVPKICENFMKLAQRGYYDGTTFHRSIRNFMIQGGDPTGTGNGGESMWGKPFEDCFKSNLSHSDRGILSMVSKGPNSNGSQFFITFRSCRHLDGKHSVFGRVVGGLTTLTAMERIETDNKDRPVEDIVIESAQIFVDPYQEADDQLAAEREEAQKKATAPASKNETFRSGTGVRKVYKSGVGKYIDMNKLVKDRVIDNSLKSRSKNNATGDYKFGNFSSW